MAGSLLDNTEFILDLCRFSEKLITEEAVRKKYRLPEDVWQGLGNDDELVEAIEAEKVRRIRNGTTAREKAQQLFASAPDVLGKILNADDNVSPRHKIESARELRAIAANTGPENGPAADEKFQITIVLSADERLTVDKRFGKIDPNDGPIVDVKPQPRRAPITNRETDDDDLDTAPLLAMITANKRRDDGNGEPI